MFSFDRQTTIYIYIYISHSGCLNLIENVQLFKSYPTHKQVRKPLKPHQKIPVRWRDLNLQSFILYMAALSPELPISESHCWYSCYMYHTEYLLKPSFDQKHTLVVVFATFASFPILPIKLRSFSLVLSLSSCHFYVYEANK